MKVYGDFRTDRRAAIVSLNIGDYDSAEISDELSGRYGIVTRSGAHCAPLMHEALGFPTTDALEVIRKVLGMKADYFIHYDYGYYGYKEHYAYGEIKVMASDDEHMGVFLELKGAGSRNMEYVLQAQNRDWYSFLNRCLDCGGVIRRFDLAINDMCGLLDIPVLSEKYKNGGADCRCKNYENVQGG